MMTALEEIRRECDERVRYFQENNKLIEAQRIAERTNYDVEMLSEIGFCKGIENYSRVLSGRRARAAFRIPCSIISRRIFSSSSTSRMSRCRRRAGCWPGTARARGA